MNKKIDIFDVFLIVSYLFLTIIQVYFVFFVLKLIFNFFVYLKCFNYLGLYISIILDLFIIVMFFYIKKISLNDVKIYYLKQIFIFGYVVARFVWYILFIVMSVLLIVSGGDNIGIAILGLILFLVIIIT